MEILRRRCAVPQNDNMSIGLVHCEYIGRWDERIDLDPGIRVDVGVPTHKDAGVSASSASHELVQADAVI